MRTKPSEAESNEIGVESLNDLLEEHDERMRKLFAQALNLFVAPDMDGVPDKERLDRLRQAVEQSLK